METRSSNMRAPPASGPNICRVCLMHGGAMATVPGEARSAAGMESIFTLVGEYEDKSLYGILLSICTPLGQRETLSGGVPERICRSCKWRLLAAYELHLTCLRSDDKLRERLEAKRKEQQLVIQDVTGGVKIKQEVPDPDEQDVNQNTTADAIDLSAIFAESYLPHAESTLIENDLVLEETGDVVDPHETLFEEHYELNEKGNHSCNICKQEFYYKSQCRSHIISKHDPAKPFKCDECHYTLTTELRLIRHKATFHGIGVLKIDPIPEKNEDGETTDYTCKICSKTFESLVRFKRHKNVHIAFNRPFKCDICLYRFTTRSQFSQHVKLHQEKTDEDGEPAANEWPCEYCDEKLSGKRAVTMHVRRCHPAELLQAENREKNDYKCIICEEAFSRESVLNTHLKMHELLAFEKEKEQRQELERLVKKELQAQLPPIKNEPESGASLDLSNVSLKKKSDSDILFVCVVCDQEFEARELLLKHQRKLHKELELNIVSDAKDVPQPDPVNNDNSTAQNDQPVNNDNEESMVVDLDPSDFTDGETPQKVRASSGGPLPKCDLCQKTFAYNCLLQTHMKNSHSEAKPFECKVCRMRFGYRGHLQKHELIHSAQNIQAGHHGSILYKCRVCSAKFLELKALTVHLRTHRPPVEPPQPKKVEIFQCSSCPQIFQGKDKLDEHVANVHRPGGGAGSGGPLLLQAPSGSMQQHQRMNPDPRRVAQRKPMSEKERFFGSLSIVKVEHPSEPVQMDL